MHIVCQQCVIIWGALFLKVVGKHTGMVHLLQRVSAPKGAKRNDSRRNKLLGWSLFYQWHELPCRFFHEAWGQSPGDTRDKQSLWLDNSKHKFLSRQIDEGCSWTPCPFFLLFIRFNEPTSVWPLWVVLDSVRIVLRISRLLFSAKIDSRDEECHPG